MWVLFLRVSLLLVLLAVGLPCFFLGMLGVSGHLSDTSDRENVQSGLLFLSIAVGILMACVLSFTCLKHDKTPGNGAVDDK